MTKCWSGVLIFINMAFCYSFTFFSQVGESSLQSGNLYSSFMSTCRTFFLGSNQSDQGYSYRGHVGGLILWDHARSQADLLKQPPQNDQSEPILAMWADFTNVITLLMAFSFFFIFLFISCFYHHLYHISSVTFTHAPNISRCPLTLFPNVLL